MKVLLLLAVVMMAVSASTEDIWIKFKETYGKTYKSIRDDKLRFEIFKSTLETIERHNAKYENAEETWFMGINEFSDLTDEEFKVQYLTYRKKKIESFSQMTFNVSVPNSFDWRSKGAVLSVKNQGRCGSCWAFSAVGALEGQNAIKHRAKTDLSSQELVDCATGKYSNKGCKGGWMDNAFSYVKDHGIDTLSSYPYHGVDERCKLQKNSARVKVTGFRDIAHNENQLKQAVASIGPISVAIDADKIKNYKGGIFNNPECGNSLNHAMLIVGYGTGRNNDFWIVKNSWGSSWGEHGYIRMSRNKHNQCGISSAACYPVLA